MLHKDRAYASPATFYLNRALRIYPAYWVMAGGTFALWLVSREKLHAFVGLNPSAAALLVVSNLILFGQDVVMFTQQTGHGIGFALDFTKTSPPLWKFLLIPPAWSLSLELTFYALAPFIVRRVPVMLGLTAVSLVLTGISWRHGLAADPWTYRFFPFELSLFLLGALSERLLLSRVPRESRWVKPAPVIVAVALLVYPFAPMVEPLRTVAVLALFAALLPALFRCQHGRRWDILIGDLSYPLYIGHWLVVSVINKVWEKHQVWPDAVRGGLCLAGALVVALLLERLVARPVEKLRRRVRQASAPVDTLEAVLPGALEPPVSPVAT